MKILGNAYKFEWDKGNINKNLKKHNVGDKEAEEVFLDNQRFIFKDSLHSYNKEERFRILGKTEKGRLLFIVFTLRRENVRIISARDINRKEVHLYEKKVSSTKIQK